MVFFALDFNITPITLEELPPIIKLDATDSTNVYLKALLQRERLEDFTTVIAKKQLKGKGQRGASWHSEPGKNLTFSVLKHFESFSAAHQFTLNRCVSLAIYDVLKAVNIPHIAVKWPNDIMSGLSKICGVLLENTIKGNCIQHSIIGIGLNVNQTSFGNLHKAGSLRLATGREFNLHELLHNLLKRLKDYLLDIEKKPAAQFLTDYQQLLFRKDQLSTFTRETGEVFKGYIRGVSAEGRLLLESENSRVEAFALKQVSLLY